jgi:PAS domain S-box-containing protein
MTQLLKDVSDSVASTPAAASQAIDPAWYRELVEAAPDATVIIDSSGRIVLVNAQTEKLFGYPREELLGQAVEILVPERYRGGHGVRRDGFFAEPKVREMGAGLDLWGRRKDGSEFPVEISLSPLRTAHGVYATAAIRDATNRKRANEKFRALLESAPDAMVIIDQQGLIRLVNAQAERLFGYRREALTGKSVEVLIPERLRERHAGHRGGYFLNPKVREMGGGIELCGRRKDGSEFPIEISLSPLATEDGIWATAAVRDVTERKRYEQRFRGLLETAPDAMVIIGADGIISLVNAQTEHMFGYTREELVGQGVEMLVPERFRDKHIAHRGRYFHQPKVRPMGAGLELWGRRKDGSEFPIEISLGPMVQGAQGSATAAVRDISDRKAVDRKLAEYAEHLERSNRDLEQFAYIASHDLSAPLRSLSGFAQLLRKRYADKLDDTGKEFVDFINDGARQMKALIDGLLTFSRVGRDADPEDAVDLQKVLEQVERQLLAVVNERGAQISHDPLPQLPGSARELNQLLQNLLSNAIKFQPGERPVVHVGARREGSLWQFSIRDQGIGIAPEHQQKIFQIFQRLHTAEEYDGTGIGLAVCQKIVQRHGGRIWVESEIGKGSVFHFTLRA